MSRRRAPPVERAVREQRPAVHHRELVVHVKPRAAVAPHRHARTSQRAALRLAVLGLLVVGEHAHANAALVRRQQRVGERRVRDRVNGHVQARACVLQCSQQSGDAILRRAVREEEGFVRTLACRWPGWARRRRRARRWPRWAAGAAGEAVELANRGRADAGHLQQRVQGRKVPVLQAVLHDGGSPCGADARQRLELRLAGRIEVDRGRRNIYCHALILQSAEAGAAGCLEKEHVAWSGLQLYFRIVPGVGGVNQRTHRHSWLVAGSEPGGAEFSGRI